MTKVTDPALLAQLNGPTKVTDPAILAQLNDAAEPEKGLGEKLTDRAAKALGSENIIEVPIQAAKGAGDVLGSAASEITPNFVKKYGKEAASALADTRVGRAAQYDAERIGEFGERNPAVGKPLELVGAVTGVEALANTGKLASKGVKAGTELAASEQAKNLKPLLGPKPVDKDIADIVKKAESAGIKVPTAGLLPKGGVLAEHANVSGMKEYTEAVNKKAADLIGANENGGKFTVVNEQALNAANKNVDEGFDKVAKEIGKVPIGKPVGKSEQLAHQMHGITPPETAYSKIEKIVGAAMPSDRPGWKRITGDARSLVDADGNIEASDIKKLISYNSDLAKKARSTASDAGEARKVISILKGQLYAAANDTQKAALADLDHKYKLLIAFDKAGTRVGAGQTLTPEKLRDVIDSAYKESGENQYPARELKTLLDTLHPPTGTTSSIRGLTNPKLSAGVTGIGNPLKGSVTGRVLESVPSFVSSRIVNSPNYRKKLLSSDHALGAEYDHLTAPAQKRIAP